MVLLPSISGQVWCQGHILQCSLMVHSFSLVFHIMTSCSALGVKVNVAVPCIAAMLTKFQSRGLRKEEWATTSRRFHFSVFCLKGKTKRTGSHETAAVLPGHLTYSMRVRTLVSETLSLLHFIYHLQFQSYCIIYLFVLYLIATILSHSGPSLYPLPFSPTSPLPRAQIHGSLCPLVTLVMETRPNRDRPGARRPVLCKTTETTKK